MPGLSLLAFEPLSEQGLYGREFIQDLTGIHQGYTHTISAVGGFDSASFSLRDTAERLDDWFEDGLLRRIVLYNPEAIPVWEGFVSRLSFANGSLTKTKAVDSMYNRILMRYAPLDFSVFPPVVSPPISLYLNDNASQARYGVKCLTISGGERASTTAYDWARNVLAGVADPKVGETVNLGGDYPSLEVECQGYYHALKWVPYESASTATIQAHQVVREILQAFGAANPGWLSSDYGWMDYNFRTARRGADELLSCWDAIAKITKEGGRGGERWVAGLYQDRRMVYKPAEDEAGLYGEYFRLYRALGDPNQFIYDEATGTEVKPWDMVPDRILKTTDLWHENLMYIESVTFREPYGLTLVGGDDMRLDVYLAQRGLPSL